MGNQEFIRKVYELIAIENINIYKDLFNSTDVNEVTDSYWKESLELYRGLSEKNKVIFFKIMKQVGIDTISNILSVIDGVTFLEGQHDELDLTFKMTGKKINGELQDLFLEYATVMADSDGQCGEGKRGPSPDSAQPCNHGV